MVDPDQALMSRVAQNDEAAVCALVRFARPILYNVAHTHRLDRDDLSQDVLIRLWRSAGRFCASKGCLRTWVNRIAQRRAYDLLRLRRTRRTVELGDVAIEPEPEAGTFDGLMPDVTAASAESLRMVYGRRLSFKQTAVSLGVPMQTVKSRVQRGLATIRGRTLAMRGG